MVNSAGEPVEVCTEWELEIEGGGSSPGWPGPDCEDVPEVPTEPEPL